MFEAWTNPEIMARWFFPVRSWSAVTTMDVRVGGRWRHEMIDDGSAPHGKNEVVAGKIYPHWGEYLEVTPPTRLVFTWNSHLARDTRVTVELRDLGDETELTLTHELLPTPEQREAHDGGWTACLAGLTALFSK